MHDKVVENLIKKEKARQKKVINLIASENYVSDDVLKALGSELVNKYAEGYPGARYYGGNEIADKIENLCRDRALKLFKLNNKKWSANVQPLSGSPANLAVYMALVPLDFARGNPVGKIMGMELSHGGHLTHGHKVSVTGKLWKQIPYGVDKKTELLDYNELKKIARKNKPDLIVAGFTAYPRKINWKKFREIADASGAILMADISHLAGLIAGGVYPSPFPYADVVTTTMHKTLRGPRSAMIFARSNVKCQMSNVSIVSAIDKMVFPGLQGGPHLNKIAASAVALKEASTASFKKYAKQVVKNAQALSNELTRLGWRIVSGETDSHLLLVDTWLDGKGIGGKEASNRLEKEGIIVNKNTIPFDKRKPWDPSGIRLGTAAETTRGAKEKDFIKIAQKINKILRK